MEHFHRDDGPKHQRGDQEKRAKKDGLAFWGAFGVTRLWGLGLVGLLSRFRRFRNCSGTCSWGVSVDSWVPRKPGSSRITRTWGFGGFKGAQKVEPSPTSEKLMMMDMLAEFKEQPSRMCIFTNAPVAPKAF